MADLIAPHGGLTEPIDRMVPADEEADFRKRVGRTFQGHRQRRRPLTLYRIGDGGLSPLTGPMDGATFNKVLDDEVLEHNGKASPGRFRSPSPSTMRAT